MKELPNQLNLFKWYPLKHTSHICKRCNTDTQDDAHWLTCVTNPTTITNLLQDTTNQFLRKHSLPPSDINNFIQAFTRIHIMNQTPLGIITTETLTLHSKFSSLQYSYIS